MSLPVTPTTMDRLWTAFRQLITAELPALRFLGIYEYSIQAVTGGVGGTIDCTPTDTSINLPAHVRLPMKPGVLGGSSRPSIGTLCRVAFVNGDPGRPCVIGVDAVDLLTLVGGTSGAARDGDSVQVSIPALTVVIAASGATLNPMPISLTGTITSGSAQVKIG